MSNYCDDCGCRTSDGICSNCHEELHILTFQSEDVESVSSEFQAKANEQAFAIAAKREDQR